MASAMAEIAAIRAEMDAHPGTWGGQAGAGNRSTMEALLALAERTTRLDVTASIRQLAELTTVSSSTVDRAIDRLAAAGWLRIDAGAGVRLIGEEDPEGWRDGHGLARLYHLLVPLRRAEPVPEEELADPRTGELPAPRWAFAAVHDVFVRRGLGPVAGLVYARLGGAPIPAELVAARVGYRPATVRRHLAELARYGLAVRGSYGWIRGAGDLEQVAVELGVAGTRAERAVRHAEQRERYLAWALAHANRRGYRVERGLYRPAAERLPLAVDRPAREIPAPRGRHLRAVSAA
jgi:DNA-binding IscR family transcriptional regulator